MNPLTTASIYGLANPQIARLELLLLIDEQDVALLVLRAMDDDELDDLSATTVEDEVMPLDDHDVEVEEVEVLRPTDDNVVEVEELDELIATDDSVLEVGELTLLPCDDPSVLGLEVETELTLCRVDSDEEVTVLVEAVELDCDEEDDEPDDDDEEDVLDEAELCVEIEVDEALTDELLEDCSKSPAGPITHRTQIMLPLMP